LKLANKIKAFFDEIEKVWEAIPGYVKVFLYSTVSAIVGLYFSHQLSYDAVFAIVLTNLGLYGVPRIANRQVRKIK